MRQILSFRGALASHEALGAFALIGVGQMLVVGLIAWAFGRQGGMAPSPVLASVIALSWMALAIWISAATVAKWARRHSQAGLKV